MGFFDSIFGGQKSNPANQAMPYLNQIPGQISPYFQPYINAGQNALPQLQGQYGQLLNNPGGRLNEIGQGYKESPGLQFAIQKALNATNAASNAQGMGGSPQNREYDTELATNYANQDFNNWLQQATGLYGQGLQGEQGLASGGLQAGTSMADQIAQNLAQQANLKFRGQQEQNSQRNSFLGGLGSLAGSALGAFNPFSGYGSSMFGGG